MKLQILIPQYKEDQSIIKSMLDSLQTQQGIDFNDFGVIVTNDGSDVIIPDKFFEQYPFKIDYYLVAHGGVSATRNFCLDRAAADYVMFCDADDMFLSNAGLWVIFNAIEQGFDVFISTFSEEQKLPNGKMTYINHDNDATFVHGKIYRREYLIENRIRFNPQLTIHEDSYFNYLARVCTEEKNIRYGKNAFYLWKYREDSICRKDKEYLFKTYCHMIKSTSCLTEELIRRGKLQNAEIIVANFIYDTYFMSNKKDWNLEENRKYLNKLYKDMKPFIEKYFDLIGLMKEKLKREIIVNSRNRSIRSGCEVLEKITFENWIEKIKNS